jgi:hypothetical protein
MVWQRKMRSIKIPRNKTSSCGRQLETLKSMFKLSTKDSVNIGHYKMYLFRAICFYQNSSPCPGLLKQVNEVIFHAPVMAPDFQQEDHFRKHSCRAKVAERKLGKEHCTHRFMEKRAISLCQKSRSAQKRVRGPQRLLATTKMSSCQWTVNQSEQLLLKRSNCIFHGTACSHDAGDFHQSVMFMMILDYQ